MEIQLIRNATVVIGLGDRRILIDPCLSPKGRLPPFTFFRRPPRLNPTTDLPENTQEALTAIDAALLTHFRFGHLDHLDRAGLRFLKKQGVPVFCGQKDERALKRKGLKARPVPDDSETDCLGGTIRAVPSAHGSGILRMLMGPGVGFFLRFPGQPSLYLAGDTVLTERVRRVLKEWEPEVCVVNAGGAVLDVGRPILMPVHEILEFVRLAPGKVVAVHMEAFNHCATTRAKLKSHLDSAGLSHKILIPADGELISL